MDPKAEEFLKRLKTANAEDLRDRIEQSARRALEESGLSEKRLKEINIDVSDFLPDGEHVDR